MLRTQLLVVTINAPNKITQFNQVVVPAINTIGKTVDIIVMDKNNHRAINDIECAFGYSRLSTHMKTTSRKAAAPNIPTNTQFPIKATDIE